MTAAKKSIHAKLADARHAFHQLELKKSGKNKFAGYEYFELGDFLVQANECLRTEGLLAVPSFDDLTATMTVFDSHSDATLVVTSPMRDAALKGCHPIQNLGAVETYQIRYLMVALMAIVEHDALDSQPLDVPDAPKVTKKKVTKKVAVKTAPPAQESVPVPASDDDDVFSDKLVIEDESSAIFAANAFIKLAQDEKHCQSVAALADFWRRNKGLIDLLQLNFPNEHARVKSAFTTLRKQVQE